MSTKYIVNNVLEQTINGDLTVNGNVVITGTTNTTPYKTYVAVLTQTGEAAPVATVFENTFNETFSINRQSEGTYIIVSTNSGFTTDKTFVIIQAMTTFRTGNIAFNQLLDVGVSEISIRTYDTSFSPADATFATPNKIQIEIRVYN